MDRDRFEEVIKKRREERAIVYGRGGRFPGLEGINVFGLDGLVYVQVFEKGAAAEALWLRERLEGIFPGRFLSVVDRSEAVPRMLYRSEGIPEEYVYVENGLRFGMDFNRPSHPGLFWDIAPARLWVRAHAQGKRVLNLFAFTCGFSVYAAAGGAAEVVNVDNNSNVLARGRRNHRLSGLDTAPVRFDKKDVMKSFGHLEKRGPWDLMICDPPSFQKGSFSARKNYPKVVRRLSGALAEDGRMLLCLNDPFLGFDFLEEMIAESGLEEMERIAPAQGFEQADPEKGLKVVVARRRGSRE